ncbi:MAG TPA: WHG domain-containing protein [Actinospica sp.]|nr:WHG domain-containing protein [Actinospica sp.]
MARAGVSVEGLVRAAAELADEVGFAQVTVSALARRFSVTVASLYSHVKNIEELRVRVAALALGELADLGAEAVAGRAGKDALVAFAGAYRGYALSHPGRYAAAGLRVDASSVAAAPALRNSELIRALLRQYGLSGAEEVHAVRLVSSVVHGFAGLEGAGAFVHSGGVDESWARALDALDVALVNWPRP